MKKVMMVNIVKATVAEAMAAKGVKNTIKTQKYAKPTKKSKLYN